MPTNLRNSSKIVQNEENSTKKEKKPLEHKKALTFGYFLLALGNKMWHKNHSRYL